jgi:hypothetical protein
MGRLVWIVLIVLARVAAADDPPSDRVQGFVAPGTGELSGRVTDADGQPLANATVHLVSKHGERTITTDAQGRFKTTIGEPTTLVAVYGNAAVSGSAVSTQRIDGAEAIELRDALPPAKLPKALSDPTVIPEYSAAMMDDNAWTRAWLLLEVNESGVVSRVKLLNPPGHDLDAIAVRDAFKLTFEPARNRADKPVRSQVLWRFEWPAFWWMKDNNHARRRMPREAYKVPCRGTGPTHSVYRDCSPANLAAAINAPWLERKR